MNGLVWVFSAVLAVVFLTVGMMKAFRYEQARQRLAWVGGLPRVVAQVLGIAEILGALGLILPAAIGLYPWLTPVAAIALGVLMLSATVFHLLRREKDNAMVSGLLLVLLGIVTYLRWPLMP